MVAMIIVSTIALQIVALTASIHCGTSHGVVSTALFVSTCNVTVSIIPTPYDVNVSMASFTKDVTNFMTTRTSIITSRTVSMTTSLVTPYPTVSCIKAKSSNHKGLTYSKAAGLFVGMFITGIIVGTISTFFICWLRQGRSRKYKEPSVCYSRLQLEIDDAFD